MKSNMPKYNHKSGYITNIFFINDEVNLNQWLVIGLRKRNLVVILELLVIIHECIIEWIEPLKVLFEGFAF